MNELYSIYDALAEEYGPPFPAKNDAVAWRKAKQMLKGYDLENSPELSLFQIGTFDVSTGAVMPNDRGTRNVPPTAISAVDD